MGFAALGLFCASLVLCIIFKLSILYAMLAGLLIFSACALALGHSLRELFGMLLSGMLTAKSVLLMLLLIGILTASWRASGTIPILVCYAAELIHPQTAVLMAFLLNCGVSMLTGTAFGTASTIGIISMSMGLAFGADPAMLGGAILSGVYFGDRCSPMSTSALLVSELTETNIFSNVRKMLKSALVPFILCCTFYALYGFLLHDREYVPDLFTIFGRELKLHWLCLIPTLLVIVMCAFKINVLLTMCASIVAALIIALCVQQRSLSELIDMAVFGYRSYDAELAALLDGGGIVSMLRSIAIITISSSYAGIFSGTGLLHTVKENVAGLSRRITSFGAVAVTAVLTCSISCNQTLAIMLTHQLCADSESDRRKFAMEIEDTTVLIAPLIPWSIAGAVPLALIGAPESSLFAACFLYILPLCSFIRESRKKEKSRA